MIERRDPRSVSKESAVAATVLSVLFALTFETSLLEGAILSGFSWSEKRQAGHGCGCIRRRTGRLIDVSAGVPGIRNHAIGRMKFGEISPKAATDQTFMRGIVEFFDERHRFGHTPPTWMRLA